MLPPKWPRPIEERKEIRMNAWLARMRERLADVWSWLRQVSEDDAYERYRAVGGRNCCPPKLTAPEFYLRRLEQKYSRPSRCC